ncbi:hypothetical protein GCM10022256_22410 [Frondihabitans peucedani]|uniref:Uncharacterized protein n=1 Tax=Frondihabitans peucedani TaxID=598626 RepID=A0ABP8E327_9MICO
MGGGGAREKGKDGARHGFDDDSRAHGGGEHEPPLSGRRNVAEGKPGVRIDADGPFNVFPCPSEQVRPIEFRDTA